MDFVFIRNMHRAENQIANGIGTQCSILVKRNCHSADLATEHEIEFVKMLKSVTFIRSQLS